MLENIFMKGKKKRKKKKEKSTRRKKVPLFWTL